MLKTIFGHPIKNLESAEIVSSAKAKILLAEAIKQDKSREKYGLTPIVHPDLKNRLTFDPSPLSFKVSM